MSETNGNEGTGKGQKILVTARSSIEISDVTEVVSFDEEEIVLETKTGKLSIEGDGLKITVLSLETGGVSAVGKINGIVYLNERSEKRSGLFGRRG